MFVQLLATLTHRLRKKVRELAASPSLLESAYCNSNTAEKQKQIKLLLNVLVHAHSSPADAKSPSSAAATATAATADKSSKDKPKQPPTPSSSAAAAKDKASSSSNSNSNADAQSQPFWNGIPVSAVLLTRSLEHWQAFEKENSWLLTEVLVALDQVSCDPLDSPSSSSTALK